MHPQTVVYLEHDGKLLLVNEQGHGPQDCIMGRQEPASSLRFPTIEEVDKMGIDWDEERQTGREIILWHIHGCSWQSSH